jgi:hypothetical protein
MNAEIVLGAAVAVRAVVEAEVGRGPRWGVGGLEEAPPGVVKPGECTRYARMKRCCSSIVG